MDQNDEVHVKSVVVGGCIGTLIGVFAMVAIQIVLTPAGACFPPEPINLVEAFKGAHSVQKQVQALPKGSTVKVTPNP